MQESTRETRMAAFEEGARKTATGSTPIFIDLEEIFNEVDGTKYLESFKQHIEQQEPGLAALYEKQGMSESRLEGMLGSAFKKGPHVSEFEMENPETGERYSFIVKPIASLDTIAESLKAVLPYGYNDPELQDKIVQNMPGSEEDYMREIGYHEGAHILARYAPDRDVSDETVLYNEIMADKRAWKELTEDGKQDVALAVKDIRYLAGRPYSLNNGHNTAVFIGSDGSELADPKLAIADIRETMKGDTLVPLQIRDIQRELEDRSGFDQIDKGEDPEAQFSAHNKALDEMIAETKAAYEKDPNSQEMIERAVKLQVLSDSVKGYEGAYRRRIMGEDVPEEKPTRIIPKDVESKFLDERIVDIQKRLKGDEPGKVAPDNKNNDVPDEPKSNKDGNYNAPKDVRNIPPEGKSKEEPAEDDKRYQNGVNGTAYTTEVSGLEKGNPNVDFNKGVTVGGQPIEGIFSQTANPNPESVSLVNAKVDTQIMGVVTLDDPKIEAGMPKVGQL